MPIESDGPVFAAAWSGLSQRPKKATQAVAETAGRLLSGRADRSVRLGEEGRKKRERKICDGKRKWKKSIMIGYMAVSKIEAKVLSPETSLHEQTVAKTLRL